MLDDSILKVKYLHSFKVLFLSSSSSSIFFGYRDIICLYKMRDICNCIHA